ncbi:hypothetical protein [Streptococcus oricebi]|uniref:DUF5082 domain-containing protein n=1 Tax=Streptococcus oricebi TaxID=1547447 RepID=A0ABS5B667_9STRE|nr:hypothetical protein [Streptococcus oricebi]MBP2624332.1 hypothetical protein [Streptococcus oricebi]
MLITEYGGSRLESDYKSANTIRLEGELKAIEAKISALRTSSGFLADVSADTIKESYEGDAGELYGNKYDELTEKEKSDIQSYKKAFMDKKTDLLGVAKGEIAYLETQRFLVNASLTISRISDAAEAERQRAERAKNQKK